MQKAARGGKDIINMETRVKIIDFSSETMEYRIQWKDNFKRLKEKNIAKLQ